MSDTMNQKLKEELELLNQQIKELAGVYKEVTNLNNISENEFWIWYSLLIVGGDYSQQDICSTWSLPKQTVNTIITNMTRRGFASLEVVPGTRNRKIIHLTEEGRAYGKSVVMPVVEAEQRAYGKLPLVDRMALSNILNKYIKALKKEISETET